MTLIALPIVRATGLMSQRVLSSMVVHFRRDRVRIWSGSGWTDESRQALERHRTLQLDRLGWVECKSPCLWRFLSLVLFLWQNFVYVHAVDLSFFPTFPTSVYFSQHLVHFLEHFIYSTFVKKVGHLWPLLCLFSSFKTQMLQKKLYVGFSRIRTGIVWKASTLTTWPPATAN